jgi:mono/diheme cytochrome c family protein
MRERLVRWIVAGAALLALVATLHAGGWAIVTVRNMPEYAVAGKPFQLAFTVRGHGIEPMDGLKPEITAASEGSVVKASAVATKRKGEYAVNVSLPHPGNWTIRIIGTLGDPVLPNLPVIAQGSPAPAPLSPAGLGERLFVAKGCIGCHTNREVETQILAGIGPDLTGKRLPDVYLKNLLADPNTAFASLDAERTWKMPNLELTKPEIAALTAFINRERPR